MASWVTLIVILLAIVCFVVATLFSRKFRKDLIAGKGEAKIAGVLSVSGAAILVMIISLIGATIHLSSKIGSIPCPFHIPQFMCHPAESAIRGFFFYLNEAIAKKSNFDQCWNMLTAAQQGKTKGEFPQLKFPADYGSLYTSASRHEVLSVVKIAEKHDAKERTYFVVFSLGEAHPFNPLFDILAQPTKETFSSASKLLSVELASQTVRTSLLANYDITEAAMKRGKSEAKLLDEIINANVINNYANRVVGPRLLTEIAAGYSLRPKPTAPFLAPEGRLAHYDVL